MWTIFFKVFIEFVTILLLFYVLVFDREACGILAPRSGIEPAPPALEGKVLTTGPPGKSLHLNFRKYSVATAWGKECRGGRQKRGRQLVRKQGQYYRQKMV